MKQRRKGECRRCLCVNPIEPSVQNRRHHQERVACFHSHSCQAPPHRSAHTLAQTRLMFTRIFVKVNGIFLLIVRLIRLLLARASFEKQIVPANVEKRASWTSKRRQFLEWIDCLFCSEKTQYFRQLIRKAAQRGRRSLPRSSKGCSRRKSRDSEMLVVFLECRILICLSEIFARTF
jgi:hypothetical protein